MSNGVNRDKVTDAWLAEHFGQSLRLAKAKLYEHGDVLSIPNAVPVIPWAKENFMLSPETTGSTTLFNPFGYQIGILEAMCDPDIEELYIPKATRTGISQLGMVAAAYFLTVLKLNVLMYQPTEDKTEEFSRDYMYPAFRDGMFSDLKRKTFRKGEVQDKLDFIQLVNMARMALSWASSDDNFRGKTTNVVMGDELDADAWLASGVKSQGKKLALAKDRYTTSQIYRKGIFWTSPNKLDASIIWPEYLKTDMRMYFVCCPHCKNPQTLEWGAPEDPETLFGIKYSLDETGTPDRAWYLCGHCHKPIDEEWKRWMIDPTRPPDQFPAYWKGTNPKGSRSKKVVGMHINALYVPLDGVSWLNLVETWRETYGNPDALKHFMNSKLGLPANSVMGNGGLSSESFAKQRPVPYEAEVPSWVRFITMNFDTQRGWKDLDLNLKPRHEVMVCGWGPGHEMAVLGFFILQDHEPFSGPAARQLDEILFREWKFADGRTQGISLCTLDGGYMQEEALAFAKAPHRIKRCIVLKGENENSVELAPVLRTPTDNDPDRNMLQMVGTRRAKNFVDNMLRNTVPGPKYIHFPKAMGDVIQHFYSERKRGLFAEEHIVETKNGVEMERWDRRHGKKNTGEVWDTLVGNYVAIHWLTLRFPGPCGTIVNDPEVDPDRVYYQGDVDHSVMAAIRQELDFATIQDSTLELKRKADIISIRPPGSNVSASTPAPRQAPPPISRAPIGIRQGGMQIRHLGRVG